MHARIALFRGLNALSSGFGSVPKLKLLLVAKTAILREIMVEEINLQQCFSMHYYVIVKNDILSNKILLIFALSAILEEKIRKLWTIIFISYFFCFCKKKNCKNSCPLRESNTRFLGSVCEFFEVEKPQRGILTTRWRRPKVRDPALFIKESHSKHKKIIH